MTRTPLALTAAAATVLALSACGADGEEEAATDTATTTAAQETATETADVPPEDDAEGEHSEADVTFARMMIPHHEQALEMSEIILAKDDVPAEVTELAERIRDAQGPEIDLMTSWLDQWGESAEGAAGDHDEHEGHDAHAMEGMLSDDKMRQLEEADGPQAAELFLSGMIVHHEGAIAMAEDQIAEGTYPPAVDLAHEIIAAQEAEIAEMEGLLETL